MFEDLNGSIEILFFAKVLEKFSDLINSGEPVMVTGKVEFEGGRPRKIIAQSLKSLKDVRREAVAGIHIRLDYLGVDDSIISDIKSVVEKHKGNCPLFFHVRDHSGVRTIKAHSSFNVHPSEGFIEEMTGKVGHDSIRYSFNRYD
jgi:DNA polymerase-3 subunit alpha